MIPPEKSRFDVVIIGAGPAGTTCAAILARQGIRVLLCDKATFPREKICGDCINPECWNIFRDLGVDGDVAADAQRITGIRIAAKSGQILDLPFKAGLSSYPITPFVAIKRTNLDSILLRRAVREGAMFCEATSIESCSSNTSERGHWEIRLRSQQLGKIFNAACDTLIGADGRNSRVAKLLAGVGNEQMKERRSDRIGIQFTVKRAEGEASDVLMFFFEGGYGGIVGVAVEESNVAMVVNRNLARLAMTNFENFMAKTIHANESARRIVPKITMTGEIHTAFPITPGGIKRKYPYTYFIGDARCTTEPFTGEGIFFAMRDGLCTAHSILKSFGITNKKIELSSRNRFWRDKVFSSVLQRKSTTDGLLALGLRYKGLAQLASKMVLR